MYPDYPCARAASRRCRMASAVLFVLTLAPVGLSHGVLTGTVSNAATGATLEGARVVLKPGGREVLTDELGSYRFDHVAPETAALSASYTGLNPTEVAVEVVPGAPTRRDIGLTSDIYL